MQGHHRPLRQTRVLPQQPQLFTQRPRRRRGTRHPPSRSRPRSGRRCQTWLLLAGAIGYAVHRHPALTAPLTAAGMAVALVVTCVCTIAAR
ncbi:hypothetical protein [Streptomyces sp. NBC_01264]|uniref:hypothetical protein n=1 Tax=Streptomyces sp. NBC_01264 TaxID=2903804 RepID=UPI00225A5AFE|nr:hypothetical protein [Streptomyces sp. NBC_01264]MCX4783784.1 hypothetical protein [Streptomyces sp. NBC_01264]